MTPPSERTILAWRRALARNAVQAAIYSLLITGMLIAHAVRIHATNPWTAPALIAMKARITQGKERQLSDEYRQLDAWYNTRFTAERRAMTRGIPLLAGGIAIFLLAGLLNLLLRRSSIDPRNLPTAQPTRLAMAGRYAVGVFALILAGVLIGLIAI